MSNKMAPDLGKLDELAKVHALSYASPHHFTMSVNGLREVIAELQLPAGNKMALDALTAAKTQLEILLPDYGRVHDETEALAKIDAAIAALQAEPQPEHELNAARLAFMQKQMLAADFDYDGECVLVFQWPRSAPVGADLIRNIDAALLATPPKD